QQCILGPLGFVRIGSWCGLEQSEELLELVEDQQRPCAARNTSESLAELLGGQEYALVCLIVGENRRQVLGRITLEGDNTIYLDCSGLSRLNPQQLGGKFFLNGRGNQPSVDERRFARAGVAVQEDAPIDRDVSQKLARLLFSLEEDPAVDEPKWFDTAVRV